MPRTRQLFPSTFLSPRACDLLIVVASEGYLASERSNFLVDCSSLLDNLTRTFPLSLLPVSLYRVGLSAAFLPSAQRGPAVGANAADTVFGSRLATGSSTLVLDSQKVNSAVTSIEIPDWEGAPKRLAEMAPKGNSVGQRSAELFVLTPEVQGSDGGDAYVGLAVAGSDDFHVTATTANGQWHQVLARRIAKRLGLADEFELEGSDFLKPTQEQRMSLFSAPNVLVTPRVELERSRRKLYSLMPQAVVDNLAVHPKTNPQTVSVPSVGPMTMQPESALHEGAAGFRTEVWRTAEDCLMRRRIGDPVLTCRKQPVGFCLACSSHIKLMLTPR